MIFERPATASHSAVAPQGTPASSTYAVTVTSPNDLVLHHMGSFVPTLAFTPHNKLGSTVVVGARVVEASVVFGAVVSDPPHAARPERDTKGKDERKA